MKDKDKRKAKKEPEEIKLVQSGNIQEIRGLLNTTYKSNIATEVKDRPTIIVPTGILSMDLAIGNGGLIAGRVMDIHGWEGTGKTLMCMSIGGYIQRCTKIDSLGNQVNRVVAMLDAEGTFSRSFALSAGMDADNLILVQSTPDKILTGEDYFDIMALLIGRGVDYIIVDSCPALTPAQVMSNETGQKQKATTAQLMSTGLHKITPLVNASGQSIVHFINQMRGKPMSMTWERPEQETGGNALKFFSSYRFEVVRAENIDKKVLGMDGTFREKKVGVTSRVRLVKNKTAPIPPYMPSSTYHFEFDVYFESFKDDTGMEYCRGVDSIKDACEVGIRTGIIKQAGSWFTFGSLKGAGRADLYQKVRENPSVMTEIREETFQKLGNKEPVSA